MKKHLTIVIKLGTSSIVAENTHEPLLSTVSAIVETAVSLRKCGHRIILVSSGAIGMALRRMQLSRRPKQLAQVQALAAIGQSHLMALWEGLFGQLGQPIAQVLLTRTDIADRTQYLNAGNTLNALLSMGVVPIVNENDTISVAEIKFGDNDTLSAITAGMVGADYLFLMTDVDCLYDKNPREFQNVKPVEVVRDVLELAELVDVSSGGSALGKGGMQTKLVAARLATSAGITTVITRSQKPENIKKIVQYVETLKERKNRTSDASELSLRQHHQPQNQGQSNGTSQPPVPTGQIQADIGSQSNSATPPAHCTRSLRSASNSAPSIPPSPVYGLAPPPLHTRFLPAANPIRDRYFWLLHGLAPHGTLYIDEGAYRALADKAGLLPVGVVDVEGNFAQQEAVRLCVVRRLHNNTATTATTTGTTHASNRGQASPKHEHHHHQQAEGGISIVPTSNSSSTPPTPSYEKLSPEPFEAGRVLVNYSAAEIRLIKGLRSSDIESVLGYADSEYVALRENVAFLERRGASSGPEAMREMAEAGLGTEMATAVEWG